MKNLITDSLEKILDIPGLKIITLTVEDFDFICEINGKNPKDADSYSLFLAKLAHGIYLGGGMTVRNILTNNRKMIYGFALGENRWVSIPAEEMQKIHNIDHKTGKLLPPEPDVDFCDFY
jgi:hypothetical protein